MEQKLKTLLKLSRVQYRSVTQNYGLLNAKNNSHGILYVLLDT